jgi:hypothetical protein
MTRRTTEWELRERRKSEKERRGEVQELDAGGEEERLFLPTRSLVASADEE